MRNYERFEKMKNRFSKITLLVLSLVLILGIAFAIYVGAEEIVKPKIIAKNIEYRDVTAIQIAVDSATVDKDNVELVVTKADGTEITVKNPEEKTINGKNALVFTLDGIPASKICENVTIVVKSGEIESDLFTYSVAEYFYERLYSDGIINATEGKALSQKALYERYISYGAAAQDLFLNYDKDGNRVAEPVTLVDKYNVIAISNGVLANGKEVMISADSFSTTIKANDMLNANEKFADMWIVTTYGETLTTQTFAEGASVTVAGKMSVTPICTAKGHGVYYNDELITDAQRYSYDEADAVAPTIGDGASHCTSELSDGVAVFKKITNDGESYLTFSKGGQNWNADNYCTVIEFDFKLDTASALSLYYLRFRLDSSDYLDFYLNSDGKTYSIGAKDTAEIEAGKWYNIRFEIYFIEDLSGNKAHKEYAKVYVNNEYATTKTLATASGYNGRLLVCLSKNVVVGTTAVNIDNMFYAHIDKAYEQ